MTTTHFQGISDVQRHPLTFKYHYLVWKIDARIKECRVMPKKIRELKQL